MEASNALSHHHAAIEQPRRDIGGQRFPALGSFISERERDADSVVASVFVICRLAPKCCRCQLLAALLRRDNPKSAAAQSRRQSLRKLGCSSASPAQWGDA